MNQRMKAVAMSKKISMTILEKYLRASHDSKQHIDTICIDIWIEDIFLKYTSDSKIFDLFGKEFNKSTVCALRPSVGCSLVKIPLPFNIPLILKVLSPVVF